MTTIIPYTASNNIIQMANPPGEQHTIDINADKKRLEVELYSAATGGNWEKAKQLFNEHPEDITPSTRLGTHKETALCVAIQAGKTEFVEELLEMMNEEELYIGDVYGFTAFYKVVAYGQTGCARIMLNKKPDLATRCCCNDYSPLEIAVMCENSHMVRLLYEHIKLGFGNRDLIDSFLTIIDHGFYDIACLMLSENPGLGIQENSKGHTALYAIARKEKRSRFRIEIQVTEQLLRKACGRDDLIKRALFKAARVGNSDFVTTALRLYPHLAIEQNDNNHTVFYVAVQHRHVDTFSEMMHMMRYDTSVIKLMRERERNDILDLAAKLPSSGLQVVPAGGAALQLQRELLCFEKVKELCSIPLVLHSIPLVLHSSLKTERYMLLFEKEHEELRKEGEKWLISTSKSSMSVAVPVFTLAIAGLFNVPGGYKQDTGVPIHLGSIWLKTYGISYALTSTFSASSILCFFSILTSSFGVKEFLISLPSKLLFALVSLFVSIVAMMVAFVSATVVHFEHRAYPVAGLAFMLVLLATYLHLPLIVQVFVSTFRPLHIRRNRFYVSQLENKYI